MKIAIGARPGDQVLAVLSENGEIGLWVFRFDLQVSSQLLCLSQLMH